MLWDILPRWTLYSLAFFPMKKILFLHGFASSGHSGTVMTLRQLLYADGVSVIAPDLPVMPQEAMALIAQLIEDERPDVVVTSSMGGLFGEQLHGIPRVLINPAWSTSHATKGQ